MAERNLIFFVYIKYTLYVLIFLVSHSCRESENEPREAIETYNVDTIYNGLIIKLPNDYTQIEAKDILPSVEGDISTVYINKNKDTIAYNLDRYNRPYFSSVELDSNCIVSLDSLKLAVYTAYIVENSFKCGSRKAIGGQQVDFEYTIYIPEIELRRKLENKELRSLQIDISCNNNKNKCIEVFSDATKIEILK